jgi:hypothetical protein
MKGESIPVLIQAEDYIKGSKRRIKSSLTELHIEDFREKFFSPFFFVLKSLALINFESCYHSALL